MKRSTLSGKSIYRNGIFFFLILFLSLYMNSSVSYAGDIPEALLYSDSQVFFGEVKSVEEGLITIVPIQKIKGGVAENSEITHSGYTFTESPAIGQIYLCGYTDEHNPLYIWEIDCYETATLTITYPKDEFAKRMQQYLNEGLFEEAESKRLARIKEVEAMWAAHDAFMEARSMAIKLLENIKKNGKISYSIRQTISAS